MSTTPTAALPTATATEESDNKLLVRIADCIGRASANKQLSDELLSLYEDIDARLTSSRRAAILAEHRVRSAQTDVQAAEREAESCRAQLADASDLADDQIKRCDGLEQKLREVVAATALDAQRISCLRQRLTDAGLDSSIPEV